MASLTQIITEFGDPMLDFFDAPAGVDVGKWWSELASSLPEVTNYQCGQACRHFKLTRKYRTLPSIAEMMDAFHNAPREPGIAIKAAVEAQDRQNAEKWDHLLAKRAMASQAAKIAARDGWVTGLYDWVAINKREPDRHECETIKRNCLEAFASVDRRIKEMEKRIDAGDNRALAWIGMARTVRDAMHARRATLAKQVIGERQAA